MALVTSAIVAVTAAAVSMGAVAAGVATVATVTTIAAVVGGIGLAVGVVGAVTKNKDLIKVGTIMGALGAGAGLGAMAAGALGLGASQAAATATSGAAASSSAPASAQVGTEVAKSGTAAAVEGGTAPAASNLVNQSVGSGVTGGLQSSAQTSLPAGLTSGPLAANAMNGANAATQAATNFVPTPGVDAPAAPTQGTQAPSGSVAGTTAPGMTQVARLGFDVQPFQTQSFSVPNTTTPEKGFWGSLDPTTKLIAGMSGTHMVGSTIGGMMQGQSAAHQLDLQKQQMAQDQAQRELINSNNAYAPRITYGRPSGLIGKA